MLSISISNDINGYQYVPHKAVAEVSKIGDIYIYIGEVGSCEWSEPTDGPTSGWRQLIVVEVAGVLAAEMYL